jgi:hypothetical protein
MQDMVEWDAAPGSCVTWLSRLVMSLVFSVLTRPRILHLLFCTVPWIHKHHKIEKITLIFFCNYLNDLAVEVK